MIAFWSGGWSCKVPSKPFALTGLRDNDTPMGLEGRKGGLEFTRLFSKALCSSRVSSSLPYGGEG